MLVGILTVSFIIAESNSLKDKRHVVKSIVDRTRKRFNVSVAELGALNTWRRAEIGVACISNDPKTANTILNKILAFIESEPRLEVEDCQLELL